MPRTFLATAAISPTPPPSGSLLSGSLRCLGPAAHGRFNWRRESISSRTFGESESADLFCFLPCLLGLAYGGRPRRRGRSGGVVAGRAAAERGSSLSAYITPPRRVFSA